MLAAIYRRVGDGRRGIFRPYAIHVCPSALASTNDKKFIRLVGGKKHHLKARSTPMSFGEGEGTGTFWKRRRFALHRLL